MIPIAIVNAAFRETVLAARMNGLHAHQVSTLTAVVLFGLYIWWLIRFLNPGSVRRAASAGALWLILTVSFEFLFGRFVMGHPWSTLLHDYDFTAGRLWVIIPLWLALAPYIFYRLGRPE
jgi:hypothetical protein